jgi:hypothetical protein
MTEEINSSNRKKENEANPSVNRIPKRWITAKGMYKDSLMQKLNECIESRYHRILNEVKKLLADEATIVFERDYRSDNTESSFALHAFLSNSFYFYIECNYVFQYQVEYAFNNCKYEAEIRKLLDNYTFTDRATEINLSPTYDDFYRNVLAYQSKSFIYVLKA